MSYADRDQTLADVPRERFDCPRCGRPHVDRGEWATRLHHVHLCEHCGHEWDRGHRSVGVEPSSTWYQRLADAVRRLYVVVRG